LAISCQNHRSTSRRCDGLPGDFIAERPVNSFIQPAGLPIATPHIEVLRRPRESAQYVSLIFTRRCRAVGIEISMGQRGDCFDNSVLESFHATLKKDLIHRRSWRTKTEARTAVFEYIEAFYNRRRRHSRLGMRSPVDFENSTLRADGLELAASRLAPSDRKITATTDQRHAA
jgi:transposase InsO family protein